MRKTNFKKITSNKKTGIILVLLMVVNIISIGFASWSFAEERTDANFGDDAVVDVGRYSDSLTLNSLSFSLLTWFLFF